MELEVANPIKGYTENITIEGDGLFAELDEFRAEEEVEEFGTVFIVKNESTERLVSTSIREYLKQREPTALRVTKVKKQEMYKVVFVNNDKNNTIEL